jgi:AbrB family looped-hinge helix DNA binding protein
MSELVQIRKKAQLTLPQSVRRELGIEEGDFLDVSVHDDTVVLKVKKLVDKNQAWFWTERWQQGEREAEENIRSGRVEYFANAAEAIASLHEKTKGTSNKPAERTK